jgi:hypothetical protein
MRFSSAAILVLVLATAAAQRPGGVISPGGTRSGPPFLSNGNPFTRSNGSFRPGFGSGFVGPWQRSQSWPGWGSYPRQNRPLGNSLFFAMPPLILPDPGFPPDTPYYPQSPPGEDPAPPPADVTQLPTTVSPPLTNQDTHFNSTDSEPAREPCEMPTASSSDFHLYQSPGPPPSDNDDHPPLVALKNGWAYSVLRYWVQGKIVHFITSQGDHMQVPVTQVERIYPSSRQSHVTNPQSPPTK